MEPSSLSDDESTSTERCLQDEVCWTRRWLLGPATALCGTRLGSTISNDELALFVRSIIDRGCITHARREGGLRVQGTNEYYENKYG